MRKALTPAPLSSFCMWGKPRKPSCCSRCRHLDGGSLVSCPAVGGAGTWMWRLHPGLLACDALLYWAQVAFSLQCARLYSETHRGNVADFAFGYACKVYLCVLVESSLLGLCDLKLPALTHWFILTEWIHTECPICSRHYCKSLEQSLIEWLHW